ncbi:oligosaccharide flippase family protein [Phycisphaerales bacterium AB-hyl4]|uniref:Oligosaccharide flippase family protein n=1 Tax=Natronomicrosphaera hydrolytica TaxID=3242702 RepID=A0ABV4U6Z1_9BACT
MPEKHDSTRDAAPEGLRRKVLHGGTFLVVRQGLGIVINTIGLLLLLWAIGAANYGLYMAAIAFYLYFFQLAQCGINVYLIRRKQPLEPVDYHQAFTLLLLIGVGMAGASLLGLPALSWWVDMEGFAPVAMVLFLGLPLALVNMVPSAQLERALDYRRVAMLEFAGQLIYQAVTLSLAFSGWGPFSPLAGWWAQHVFCCVALHAASGYRPRLHWQWSRIREMCGYGLGFSSSMWIWHLRNVVNPLVIGPTLGAAAVGQVALANRLADLLSFVKEVAWRMSISSLAHVQNDLKRMAAALNEGMRLQVLAVGPLLAGFGLLGPIVVDWLPAETAAEWTPAVEIYPFIAASYLMHALFSLQISGLYALRHNWAVTLFHAANLICFAGVAWLLTPHLGLMGFGWAELSALGTYFMIYVYTARRIGVLHYTLPLVWTVAFGLVSFWPMIGPAAGLGLVVAAVWPGTWQALFRYGRRFRQIAAKRWSAWGRPPGGAMESEAATGMAIDAELSAGGSEP